MTIEVTTADAAEIRELADVAATTFPLACPPSATPQNIAAFIDENLSEDRFRDYLADPDRVVLAARENGRIVGYAMLIHGVPDDDDVQHAVTPRPAVELSKMYVLPDGPRRRCLRGADGRVAEAARRLSARSACGWASTS